MHELAFRRGAGYVLVAFIWFAATGVVTADEGVDTLLRGLQSTSCETRRDAIAAYHRSPDNKTSRNAALRTAQVADPELREQIASVVGIIDDDREGAARITTLVEEISNLASLPDLSQGPEL